jgi:hypothetical protein
MRFSPTNVALSVILESEDYGLKASINAKVTGSRLIGDQVGLVVRCHIFIVVRYCHL